MGDSDRGFVSQYSQQDVGIAVAVSGVPTDADGAVTVTITNTDTGMVLLSRAANHSATGMYDVTLTPDDTAILGNYTATWSYLLAGDQKVYSAYFSVGGAEPAYDALADDMKGIVDQTWIRVADMYDSPSGGPNLQTWRQANFNKGRLAQLLRLALGRLNTMAQPSSTYSLDPGGAQFPSAQWGALLEQLLWIECIKHLRRSYLEQPVQGGSAISLLDRQQYFDRWGQVLQEEQANVEDQLSIFKISQMFLGRPAILVSGGVFPKGSYRNQPFMAGRGVMRFANFY